MERVRIACVRYLNTLPLIHGLEKVPNVELVLTVPSRIAEMVRKHEADVGLVSLADAAHEPETAGSRDASGPALTLLPVGMIGCDGPTMTVRLFSSAPLDRVVAVHADTDSRTSIVLCRVLLKRLFDASPTVIPFDARERVAREPAARSQEPGVRGQESGVRSQESGIGRAGDSLDGSWPETILLIGDKVVTDPPPADRFPHQLDLGEAWKEWTGLPFVYAAWACRADEAGSPRVQAAAALLDRQRRRNGARLDWIVDRFAPEHRWPPDLARRYIGSLLRYDFGPREREGAERFLAEAATLGLITSPEVAWGDADLASTGGVPRGA